MGAVNSLPDYEVLDRGLIIVEGAGALDNVSAMRWYFPAVYFTSNLKWATFSRKLWILVLVTSSKFIFNIDSKGG